MVICNRSPIMYQVNIKGQIVTKYINDKASGQEGHFVACAVSPRGEFLYGVAEDNTLYCFELATGVMVQSFKLHDKHVNDITHHPHLNLLASCSDDSTLKCWKP